MSTSLDDIMSRGEAMPASETQTPAPQDTTQPDAAVQGQQTDQDPEPEGTTVGADGQKTVPLQALHAERQKVKRYTEEVADFRKQLESQAAESRRFQQQMLERLTPQQKQEQAPPPDWYENPDNAMEYRLRQMMAPVIQQTRDAHLAVAREATEARYGEKANGAIAAFDQAAAAGQLDPAEYQRVMSSPNPFSAAVQWHEKQQRLSPDYEAQMRADERAKVLAELGIQTGTQPAPGAAAPAPVMPSNLAGVRNVGTRSGPAWSGPTQLGSIFKT